MNFIKLMYDCYSFIGIDTKISKLSVGQDTGRKTFEALTSVGEAAIAPGNTILLYQYGSTIRAILEGVEDNVVIKNVWDSVFNGLSLSELNLKGIGR